MILLVLASLAFAGDPDHHGEDAHHPPQMSAVVGIAHTTDGQSAMATLGPRVTFMVHHPVKWAVEGGVAIPVGPFEVLPYVLTGPGFILSKRLSVGLYATGKLHVEEHGVATYLGAVVAPTVSVGDLGSFSVPVGVQSGVGEHAKLQGVFSLKVGVNL